MSHTSLPRVDADPRRELGAAFGAPGPGEGELGLDDAGLIAAYQAGNPAAYGELVRRHQIPLYRLLLGLLADEDIAEEACEMVFVVAERRLAELVNPNGYYQWLLAIAREISGKFNERTAHAATLAPTTADPRDQVKREIHAVLQQLAPDLRLVLVLVELRGAPDEDVAAALGCSVADVPALVDAARAEFARVLGSRAQTASLVTPRAANTSPHLKVGELVADRYRITAWLADGGMGSVYRAERVDDGLAVALKTVLPSLVRNESTIRRFDREIEAIERISHENFVKVLDHGRSGEMPFFVMEFLQGCPLSDLLTPHQPLAPARALLLISEVLRGLGHAHNVGVVHRDLKLANVFVLDPGGSQERVKILDLGLAKLVQDDEDTAKTMLTEQGMIFGTPAYMAPEQALGEEAGPRADLYAVAVMLQQLLSGRLPFESANPAALLVMQVSSVPPPLVETAPHLADTELPAVLERGLAKSPDDRFATAAEFCERLEKILAKPLPAPGTRALAAFAAASAPPTQQLPVASSPASPGRGRRVIAVIIMIMVIIVIIVIAVLAVKTTGA